jgi:hypothetical protein
MLHDGDEVPGDGLALSGDGTVEPERRQLLEAAATATKAKSSPWSARKKLAGSSGKRLGCRGWPSMPSSKLNSISLLAAVCASGRTWWLVSSRRAVTMDPVPNPSTRPA